MFVLTDTSFSCIRILMHKNDHFKAEVNSIYTEKISMSLWNNE
jgi:hypothetical protein